MFKKLQDDTRPNLLVVKEGQLAVNGVVVALELVAFGARQNVDV